MQMGPSWAPFHFRFPSNPTHPSATEYESPPINDASLSRASRRPSVASSSPSALHQAARALVSPSYLDAFDSRSLRSDVSVAPMRPAQDIDRFATPFASEQYVHRARPAIAGSRRRESQNVAANGAV